jgi:hypothetical protein
MFTFHDARRGWETLALVACAGVIWAAPVVRGQNGSTIDRPMPYMQAMSKIYRLLQDQVGDASRNASTRALAADMEWSTLSAKEAVPLGTLILPESEKKTLLDGYRRQFIKLMRQELDLEEQLLNNDNRAAAKSLAAMEETENEGHEKFR